ncbi:MULTISPECIES: hypothetical protein [Bacillaceae]|uniref:hypothetical protein n=1 Tax=Bacillaceae TaxID=186817 RepID=UPI000BFE1302|nr:MULTISPECIES: hypothetical protein [Bacillaceae]MCM3164146.1 hypothetical protein [Metabacillus litoralis]PGT84045.1 hypothetical protein COD11_11485 [Bacillus sp. AFS040349]UGB33746.1 hypothetical protein LPC09_26205 [Metabacillus sp. B2-18]
MLYDENDLVPRLEDELKYDPLYTQIKDRPTLKKEMFENKFIAALQEDLHRWYSIAEAGAILDSNKRIAASTLKHYIDNLEDYVLPDEAPQSRYIRLNYLSIVKLKMVWLLKDELKMTGLQSAVGIIGTPVNNNMSNSYAPSLDQNQELRQYMQMTNMLMSIFMERGEDGRPRLKEDISNLLQSNQKLLESGDFLKKVEEQSETIEELNRQINEEKKNRETYQQELEEKYKDNLLVKDQLISELESKLEQQNKTIKSEIDETLVKKLEENDNKFNDFVNKNRIQSRAKQMAEEEWDKQGAFSKIFGNRSEFVKNKTEEFLIKLTKDFDN